MSKQPKWVDTIPIRPQLPGRDTCTGGCETRAGCGCLPSAAKPLRKPYVLPAANDPGIGQGRNEHHNPRRDRDIVLTLALCVGGWSVPVLLLCLYGAGFVAWVMAP